MPDVCIRRSRIVISLLEVKMELVFPTIAVGLLTALMLSMGTVQNDNVVLMDDTCGHDEGYSHHIWM